jgi:hypothetical protein
VPGIKAIPAHGHTAGHSTYKIESKGQTLVLWGDLMHVAAVQFENPSVTIQFDTDSKAAAVERKKGYADAAQQSYLVGAAHLAFPGLGYVRKEGKGYAWAPLITHHSHNQLHACVITQAIKRTNRLAAFVLFYLPYFQQPAMLSENLIMRWSFVDDGIFLTRHYRQFTDTACHRSTQGFQLINFFLAMHLRIQGIHQIILPTNGFPDQSDVLRYSSCDHFI